MSRQHAMSCAAVFAVALVGAIAVPAVAGTPQAAGAASSVSREEAEALVADDPEMTPTEREGFVNALLVRPPKARMDGAKDSVQKRATTLPPDAKAELSAAGGRGAATVHLVVGESGEVIETRYVRPKSVSGGENRTPLEAYGAWAAELGRLWRFEPPAAAPYSFILDLSHNVDEKGTTYGWKLRATGRLVHQNPAAPVGAGSGAAADVQSGGAARPPVGSGKVVRVGDGVETPTKTHHVSPIYPADAKADRVQGVVVIEATIGTDGKVTDARVLKSIPMLDQAAVDAVMHWEFTPTLHDNEPVAVVLTVTVNFTLQ